MKLTIDLNELPRTHHQPIIEADGGYTIVTMPRDTCKPSLIKVVNAIVESGGSIRNAARMCKCEHALLMRTLIDHNLTVKQVMDGEVWIEPIVGVAPRAGGRA